MQVVPWAHKVNAFMYSVNQSVFDESIEYIHINEDMDTYMVSFGQSGIYTNFLSKMEDFGYIVESIDFDSKLVLFKFKEVA